MLVFLTSVLMRFASPFPLNLPTLHFVFIKGGPSKCAASLGAGGRVANNVMRQIAASQGAHDRAEVALDEQNLGNLPSQVYYGEPLRTGSLQRRTTWQKITIVYAAAHQKHDFSA